VFWVNRDREDVILRFRRFDRTAPQPLERGAFGASSWDGLSSVFGNLESMWTEKESHGLASIAGSHPSRVDFAAQGPADEFSQA
jgi:hypothetical protein